MSLVNVSLMFGSDSLTLRFCFLGFSTDHEGESLKICSYVSKASKKHSSFGYYKCIIYTGLSQSSTKTSLRNLEYSEQGNIMMRN